MPPIEIGPMRPVGAVQSKTQMPAAPAAAPAAAPSPAPAASAPAAAVETSAALSAGSPPVDTDRVSVIRKAIQEGHYPVIPTRIADAMIAAGMLLRTN